MSKLLVKKNNKIIKNPCGMRDANENDMELKNYIISIIGKCYSSRCCNNIDTPIAELQTTVSGIYGQEFNKLVYNLNDNDENNKDGEKLLLRYDLTVPFIRYVSNNGLNYFRRAQVGKVYRRDTPQINLGRYREFTQYDYDIIGDDNDTQLFDIEILDLLDDTLGKLLTTGTYTIKFNYRDILFNIFRKCDIETDKFNIIASAVDRLDKFSWDKIYDDITDEKNICINKLNKLTEIINDLQSIDYADIDSVFEKLKLCELLDENLEKRISKLIDLLKLMGISKSFIFNPLLARGLDYYTGIIYEATYNDKNIIASSIAAGGRYDNMIEKFTGKKIPAIGLSIGVDRIMTIYNKLQIFKKKINAQIYVATIGDNMIENRMVLSSQLRRAGFIVDMSRSNNPKMAKQLNYVLEKDIPIMLVIGETEIKNNTIQVKVIKQLIQSEEKRENIIEIIQKLFKNGRNSP